MSRPHDLSSMLSGKSIMITGGTGSFGRRFIRTVLERYQPRRLIVYSRDELKQFELSQVYPDTKYPAMRYFVGDVRDVERLRRAMNHVDYVIHAAALKQVPVCEYNPIEAVRTNVHGAENIINAAIDAGVTRVVALSTDKAVAPVNLYGATKLVAEKLFVQGNAYAGTDGSRFACVRYGNVVGSRGSVVPLFLKQREAGRLTITDPRMTRFWITLEQGVDFVLQSLQTMEGGEVFIPKIPSTTITDLAEAIAPDAAIDTIGIRPGEKLHEVLISEDEARQAIDLGDRFILTPQHNWWNDKNWNSGQPVPAGFRYASDNNPHRLNPSEIRKLLEAFLGHPV